MHSSPYSIIYSIVPAGQHLSQVCCCVPSYLFLHALSHKKLGAMAMAPVVVLLHALLLSLASAAAAAAAAMDNATSDGISTARVLCNGTECEPPGNPLPIYGYPPPAPPSLPSAPSTPPSPPGSQTPCPPVAVVCCGGAGMPQQPNSYGPPTGGYVPYYNASASPPALLAPITLVGYVMVACIFLLWLVV